MIAEQTKIFVEDEFRDVFNPAQDRWVAVDTGEDYEKAETGAGSDDADKEEESLQLPVLAISSP